MNKTELEQLVFNKLLQECNNIDISATQTIDPMKDLKSFFSMQIYLRNLEQEEPADIEKSIYDDFIGTHSLEPKNDAFKKSIMNFLQNILRDSAKISSNNKNNATLSNSLIKFKQHYEFIRDQFAKLLKEACPDLIPVFIEMMDTMLTKNLNIIDFNNKKDVLQFKQRLDNTIVDSMNIMLSYNKSTAPLNKSNINLESLKQYFMYLSNGLIKQHCHNTRAPSSNIILQLITQQNNRLNAISPNPTIDKLMQCQKDFQEYITLESKKEAYTVKSGRKRKQTSEKLNRLQPGTPQHNEFSRKLEHLKNFGSHGSSKLGRHVVSASASTNDSDSNLDSNSRINKT